MKPAATLLMVAVLGGAAAHAQPAPQVPADGMTGAVTDGAAPRTAGESFQPRRRPVRDVPDTVVSADPAVRVRLSGHVGVTAFTASDSFEAVLDTSSGVVAGGGGGVLLGRHLFVDVQVARFSADGERVFVTDDLDVFPLGIRTTVTVIPIDVSVGWRFAPAPPPLGSPAPRRRRRLVPFVGGGVGVLRYRETAEFAEPGDDVDESHGSYHVLGGLELAITRRLGVSADGLYRWVPDALGEGGVSAAYGETDLGGVTFRVRGTFTF